MSRVTRPATRPELAWVSPPAVRARLVTSGRELVAISEREPWRVRVTERGEAAILGRWRTHTDDCAVLGLWCSPGRVPVIVTDLLEVAREQGFGRLLGPLVPEHQTAPYLDAGLRAVERVVVMRLDEHGATRPQGGPDGACVRELAEPDLSAILSLDGECFDPFWHYDEASLTRLARTERIAVGVFEGRTVGYTLCTLRGADGSLGRIAVLPSYRRRGIGRMLADEAVGWLTAHGARRVLLSTQEDNTASRALYRGMGFRETGDVLVACASSALLDRVDGEGR